MISMSKNACSIGFACFRKEKLDVLVQCSSFDNNETGKIDVTEVRRPRVVKD